MATQKVLTDADFEQETLTDADFGQDLPALSDADFGGKRSMLDTMIGNAGEAKANVM